MGPLYCVKYSVISVAEYYRNSTIANAIDNGQHRDIWTELKKLDSHKKVSPCSINDCNNDSGIANIFANKYNNLYSSVPTHKQELDDIRNDMLHELSDSNTLENVQFYC